MEAYAELVKVFTRLHRFGHLSSIAKWDAMVNMPPKGAEARGAALAELDVLTHGIITDTKIQDLLKAAQQAPELSSIERANLYEMQRAVDKETKLPHTLVEKKAIVTSRAEQAWRKLRPLNDWNGFLPHLKDVLSVTREMGELLAKGTDLQPYEALMDMYEPGMKIGTLDNVFSDVKTWLPSLLQEVLQKNASAAAPLEPVGPFAIEKQKELGLETMRTWKFDFEGGRLDVSSHPFCGGVPEDIRLTTRYQLDNFEQSLMGIIHETGHSKYEQNRPRDLITQPVSAARSMGVHESQSLFAEMQIARSVPFMTYITPLIEKHLGSQPAFTTANILALYRRVRPGLIRVDADELCYPLHVILRYEIERALLDGTLDVENVPTEWNKKMKEYLGQDTEGNFKDGPMQDIHWSLGYIGYFPTYTLGAMYAAQMMAAVRRELGSGVVDEAIASGNLEPILEWQRAHIWTHGSVFMTDELITKATGEPLNPAHYRRHLEERYRDGLH